MSDNMLFYALGAGVFVLAAVSLAMAWQRGSKSTSALRDRRTADRARYAARVVVNEPMPAKRGDKTRFGRR
jgi:phage-related minor tail protein